MKKLHLITLTPKTTFLNRLAESRISLYFDDFIICNNAVIVNSKFDTPSIFKFFKTITGLGNDELIVIEFKNYKGALSREMLIWLIEKGVDSLLEERGFNLNKKTSSGIRNTQLNKKDSLKELENMVGLENIKDFVKRFAKFLKIQKERKGRGFSSYDISLNMVFKGAPGTGKTSVARLLGKIYKELGYLEKGHTVEVERSMLVAQYVGQTAPKTKKILEKALDGVLFIDEAYSLNTGGDKDFGKESVEMIMKFMEDNRDRLVIIAAGYNKPMQDFLDMNPGLSSRFSQTLLFPSFSPQELCDVFIQLCKTNNISLGKCSIKLLNKFFKKLIKRNNTMSFGNAREVRNLFEYMLLEQASRIDEKNIETELLNSFSNEDIFRCSKRDYDLSLDSGIRHFFT